MSSRQRGYTMMEVMMALGLLAVGATGIIAMQKAAVIGNTSARNIATATAIGERWVERLRADAMLWNSTPTLKAPAALSDINETRWLKVTAPYAPPPPYPVQVWTLPTVVPGQASPYADPLGADIILPNDDSPVAYCTHVMYRHVRSRLINATVRVTWRRDTSPIDCTDPDLFDLSTDARFGTVYLPAGVLTQERPE